MLYHHPFQVVFRMCHYRGPCRPRRI